MFLRQQVVHKGGRDYTYLKVVESTRQDGKVVQKTLLNLGSTDAWPPGRLEQVVRVLERFLGLAAGDANGGGNGPDLTQTLAAVQVSDCRQLGPYLLLWGVWEHIGLDALLEGTLLGRKRSKLSLPLAACVRAMVLHRLVAPSSKRALHRTLQQSIQMPDLPAEPLPLHGFYRALEHLAGVQAVVEQALYQRTAHLFNRDVSLVFYDLTSTYFEGKGCSTARYGYSRDHRPDCLQIEIGLLVDADGLPIGHQVFEGNRTDVSTVLEALERLKGDFDVRRCVFVSDDGMASEENLALVAACGYEYITSLALRKTRLGRQIVSELPPRHTFEPLTQSLWMRPLRQEAGVRYIGCYNPERAAANRRHRRERLRACVAKLRRLQAPLTRRSGRRMSPQEKERSALSFLARHKCAGLIEVGLDADGQLCWSLDREALRLELRRDGLLVLLTNASASTLTDEEVAQAYRTLWRVENAFRHLKDPIRLRPIRHWNDERVLGHVFVCVLAYLLERLLELRLQRAGIQTSAAAALEAMRTLTVSTLTLGERQVRRRSELTAEQGRLLAAVGVHEVPAVW